jgi:BirA family biotin operon repressor/biotin-[acetyl-CoA-carboxylase] ligase
VAEILEYDGIAVDELVSATSAAQIVVHDVVDSTMNVAHALARAGASDGTVVVAGEQTAGRGRERRDWYSPASGVWLTVIARAVDTAQLGALPIRVGLEVAHALEPFASERIGLKWPNDLYLHSGKLGGILVEARWRQDTFEWAAVGVGVNVVAPSEVGGAGLRGGTRRADVLRAIVPGVLLAIRRRGALDAAELAEFAFRDIALGREIIEPLAGTVRGVAPSGALLVEANGSLHEVHAGSVVFQQLPSSLAAST